MGVRGLLTETAAILVLAHKLRVEITSLPLPRRTPQARHSSRLSGQSR